MTEGPTHVPPADGDPEVTVVIPTRDRWAIVAAAVRSATAQQDVAVEIVVVDDGSAEGPPAAFGAGAPVPVHVARQPWSGVAHARNAGVSLARTPWVAFLDDDDCWAPTKLRDQLNAARARSARFAYSDALAVDVNGRVVRRLRGPAPDALLARLLKRNELPAGASNVLIETTLVRELGGFDAQFRHLDDWDLWIRLAEASLGAHCPHEHVAYVQHASPRAVAEGDDLVAELDLLNAKHAALAELHGRTFDRVDYARWLASSERRAGRRRRAVRVYLRSAVRDRNAGNLVRAAATAVGATRERTSGPCAPDWAISP